MLEMVQRRSREEFKVDRGWDRRKARCVQVVKQSFAVIKFFLNCAVGLWALRPLLAYCTSPG
jgi:hypothetical protein